MPGPRGAGILPAKIMVAAKIIGNFVFMWVCFCLSSML
jgi:hypothetical protein